MTVKKRRRLQIKKEQMIAASERQEIKFNKPFLTDSATQQKTLLRRVKMKSRKPEKQEEEQKG